MVHATETFRRLRPNACNPPTISNVAPSFAAPLTCRVDLDNAMVIWSLTASSLTRNARGGGSESADFVMCNNPVLARLHVLRKAFVPWSRARCALRSAQSFRRSG